MMPKLIQRIIKEEFMRKKKEIDPVGVATLAKSITTKSGRNATINDIFAFRKEAELTAKMMGLNKTLEKSIEKLKKDLLSQRSHWRSEDITYGWALPYVEFMKLAPLFKPFLDGVTQESMTKLLREMRIKLIADEHGKRAKLLPYRGRQKKYSYYRPRVKSEVEDRLFPINRKIYDSYLQLLAFKRLGVKVSQSTPKDLPRYCLYIKRNKIDFAGSEGKDIVIVNKYNIKEWVYYDDKTFFEKLRVAEENIKSNVINRRAI